MSEWRILGAEAVQWGDEWSLKWKEEWVLVPESYIGYLPTAAKAFKFRRRVSPGKEADAPIACCSVCYQMFSLTMLVEKTCAGCWKQRAEKAEALQSNCNSALKIAIEMLEETKAKLHQAEKERDEARAALDLVDLFKDEFLRIKACPDVSPEVTELCDRALSGIKQHIPVLEQRDKAEKERDQLRVEVEEARATAREECKIVCQLRAENEGLLAEKVRLSVALSDAMRYAGASGLSWPASLRTQFEQALAAKGETK